MVAKIFLECKITIFIVFSISTFVNYWGFSHSKPTLLSCTYLFRKLRIFRFSGAQFFCAYRSITSIFYSLKCVQSYLKTLLSKKEFSKKGLTYLYRTWQACSNSLVISGCTKVICREGKRVRFLTSFPEASSSESAINSPWIVEGPISKDTALLSMGLIEFAPRHESHSTAWDNFDRIRLLLKLLYE